jgi:hypothetical protein
MAAQLALFWLFFLVADQEPRTSHRDAVAFSGKIDEINPFSRAITLLTAQGVEQTVIVAPEIKVFDELKAGDIVTVRVVESVIVAVRPNAKPTPVTDTTTAAKEEADERSGVVQQLKATVVIDSVDPSTGMVTYTAGDNRRVMRMVADRQLLAGLKPRDVVEITYTRARVIDLQRGR